MSKLLLLVAFFALLCVSPAFADRTIITPSGYTMPTGYDFESFEMTSGKPHNITLLDASRSNFQFELASLERPTIDRLAVSVQVLVLPETFETPALSIGVKDLVNSAGAFSSDGYYGRAYYLAVTKSLSNSFLEGANRGLTATAGLGAGSYHGLFGGLSTSLPLDLFATTEFDGRSLNYRLALQISSVSQLAFNRIGGANWISLNFHSPVSM